MNDGEIIRKYLQDIWNFVLGSCHVLSQKVCPYMIRFGNINNSCTIAQV